MDIKLCTKSLLKLLKYATKEELKMFRKHWGASFYAGMYATWLYQTYAIPIERTEELIKETHFKEEKI